MIKGFICLLLLSISGSALSGINASNFDKVGAERLEYDFEWISNYSSGFSSSEFKRFTGVEVDSGKSLLDLITGTFPIFAAGNSGISICPVERLSYCKQSALRVEGAPRSFFVTKGSPISLWLPHADMANAGYKKGYMFLGQDIYPVSNPGAQVPIFAFQYDGMSKDAVAIVDIAYLSGLSVIAKRITGNDLPVDMCTFATKRFQCDSTSSSGYFFVVSYLISELSKKCMSCTQRDYVVLSYLFALNALSSPANKYAFMSGVEAMKKNEELYVENGMDVTDLRYRYHFGITK